MSGVKLREWTSCGGCAAKWGASPLAQLIEVVGHGGDLDLLVGLAPFDDAAVLRLDDERALVSTTDFFPPLVDDPDDFGAIAAANACSDVFAMGAQVILALNIAAFPDAFPEGAAAAILAAAARVVAEAGGQVAGGHTIRSDEPIFGLAVQGMVRPDRIWTKGGARPGQVVVLSKPVGTGVVLAGDGDPAEAISGMRTLNRVAAETLSGGPRPGAVTDVTGFGLAGHAWEVAERSGSRLILDMGAVAVYPGAREAVEAGVRTGGDARNRAHLSQVVAVDVDETDAALAFDPQTSGGLLATVDPSAVPAGFSVVGEVVAGEPGVALVRSR